ncbi:uncharacterized protein N7511_011331 [Penicillium nucicola]|uniref:uncharacterized protein n=1 Tax=Penicillium nucicola TaxID=1850975 RepID=UPI0025450B6F|nr:uncharacterized protein N7511_011331 [Penicillium nucicola]KAJ5742599.1 hypothetical protein N7511_011331 [Penicillium nucicola]
MPPPLRLGSEHEVIDESLIENPPSQGLYNLAIENTVGSGKDTSGSSEAQFATKKRKQAPTSLQPNGFAKAGFRQSNLSIPSRTAPQSVFYQSIMQELSPASLQLLCIFAALGGDKVPRCLFERSLRPQMRWSEDGYPVRLTCEYDSVGELFKAEALSVSLEELQLGSWIYLDNCDNHSHTTYSLSERGREYSARLSSVDDLRYWTLVGLQVSCHVFPRDPALEENFQKHGTHLVHVIDHLFQQSKAYDLPPSIKLALSEVLVAKARLRRVQCPQQALNQATDLLGDAAPDHIQASIALRRSIIARLEGSYHKSEEVILDYQKRALPYETANPRLRAVTRLIIISHIENLIQLENYESASNNIEDLNDWEPNSDTIWSPMELSVNFKKWSTISKIYQSRGKLAEARDYLSNCYPFLQSEHFRADPNRFQIICRLSDLLCADGYFHDARSKIEREIHLIRLHGNLPKAKRRLEVSVLGVYIAEGKYKEASSVVLSLRKQFSTISSPDISDQWLHLRSVVASAILLHCQCRFLEAVSEWENLLSLLKKYPHSFEPEGFYFGLGQISISLALLQLASSSSTKRDSGVVPPSWSADAKKAFDIGCTVLAHEDLNFWIPMVPQRYIPDLLASIRSERPSWTETSDFRKLQQKYSDFLDSAQRQTGLLSRI